MTASFTSACGSEGSDGPGIVFDPCQPTLLLPGGDASAAERASLSDALELWRSVGGPDLSLTNEAAPQVLPVGFESAAPAFFGLYRPDRGDILINRQLGDAAARAITLAHEIGHAFGLAHVNGHRSLMNPGNLRVPPAAEDSLHIYERRPVCQQP
jgi:hypothetical protein